MGDTPARRPPGVTLARLFAAVPEGAWELHLPNLEVCKTVPALGGYSTVAIK